jgi:hypothetical protein
MITNLAYTNKNKHGVFSWKIAMFVHCPFTIYISYTFSIHNVYMCKDIHFSKVTRPRESNLATWVKVLYSIHMYAASFACLIFTFTNVALARAGGGRGLDREI